MAIIAVSQPIQSLDGQAHAAYCPARMIVRQGKSSPGRPDLIECYCYVLLRTGLLTVLLYGSVVIAMYSINWVIWLSNLNIWRFIPFRDRGEKLSSRSWNRRSVTECQDHNTRYTPKSTPTIFGISEELLLLFFLFWMHGFAVLTDRGIVAIAAISVLCTLYFKIE